jgi:soluble lytic murein transglycosylase-like protein
MRPGVLSFAAALTILAALCDPAWDEVYVRFDPEGGVHLGDQPAAGYRLLYLGSSGHERRALLRHDELVRASAARNGLDPFLVHAVIRAESAYEPRAISRKGAVGLMQLMPRTALRYGVADPFDPAQNIEAGTRYLRDLLGLFECELALALAAYNAGESAVLRSGRRIPPYAESERYVRRVTQLYESLRVARAPK